MGPKALVRQLVNAAERDVSDAERSTRGRVAAETAVDLLDLVRVAEAVMPFSPMDAVRAAHRDDPEAADRMTARATIDHLRAELADLSGAMGRPFYAGDGSTGLGAALPIVRGIATEIPPGSMLGMSPVLPSVATGDVDGLIDPALPVEEGEAVEILDVGEGLRWHNGVAVAELSRQVYDFAGPAGAAILDQIFLDIADTAAERGMVQALEGFAGGTRAAGTDLPGALDDAEAQAGAAGRGAAALVVVSPTDWPKVRRQVAASWQQAPAPTVAVSSGATVGTVTVLGPSAVHLLVMPHYTAHERKPRLVDELCVLRPFVAAVRNAVAVQTVTL